MIFRDWIHQNAVYLFDNVFHLIAEVSPNDQPKVSETVLPKLSTDIHDKINSFQELYERCKK